MSKKDNKKKSATLNPASSQTYEVFYSDGEWTSKIESTLNTLSKPNTVNKERNKRREGAGAVSKKYNK